MKLYFLRHATATNVARRDADRKLTRAGRAEAKVAGEALASLGVKPGVILTSPLVRAEHTARLAAEEFGEPVEVRVVAQLKNSVSTSSLLALLRSLEALDEIILVGHSPSMPEHIAELIGAQKPDNIALAKGGVAMIDLPTLSAGSGQLRWLMRPKQLRRIARGG